MKPNIKPVPSPMRKILLLTSLGIGIAGAVSVSVLVFFKTNDEQSVTVPSDDYSQLAKAGQGTATAVSVSSPARSQAPPPPPKPASKYEEVDLLSKSKNPLDNYAAYKLIRDCVRARKDDLIVAERIAGGGKPAPNNSHEVCGDISADQVASRMILLRRAGEAGVHGAASNYADEGPTGNGYSTTISDDDPDSAAFQQELKNQIVIGAAHGDWWSLSAMSMMHSDTSGDNQPDYTQALKELDAANAAYKAEFGHDMASYAENHGRLTYFQRSTTAH